MSHICTVENYSTIRKDEIVSFATIEMELEGIMLSGISEDEKDKYQTL